MGYLVTGPDTHLFMPALNHDFNEVDRFLKQYDVFQDDPWYMIYPYLYEKFPNAKFVFLERDESSWIRSVQNFYGRDKYNNAIRRVFYGSADTISNKEDYLRKYRLHNREVKEFFGTMNNFISISIADENDAIRLQKFLSEPIRFKTFPHKNKAPKSRGEAIKKKTKFLIYGWFGLKPIFKKQLYKYLGRDKFILLRTKTRLLRSKVRVFLLKFNIVK